MKGKNINKSIHDIDKSISEYIRQYTKMSVDGLVINCPYWINRMKNGKVILRGFANGKGSAGEIRKELDMRLNRLSDDLKFKLTTETVRKFAKKERIGIDCSGFVYRVLDELLRLDYGDTKYNNLEKVLRGGINKTNVKRLTSLEYSKEIIDIKDLKLGDIIRLWGGKHALIIIRNDQKELVYAHSSSLSTKIQGVHTSKIQIIDVTRSLKDQQWQEEARTGENFGKKYFNPEKGDGVFRLKIFN